MIVVAKNALVDTAAYALRLEEGAAIVAYGHGGGEITLGMYSPTDYADSIFRDLQEKAVNGQVAYALPASNFLI